MARVDLINVEKVYGQVKVVHGIDLSIAEGEFMVLVGPSGCAKSTTLRMIAGLESITGGEIRIGGNVVNNMAPGDRGIAMVFQNYALYPHMKVTKNLSFGLRIRGKKKAEIDPAVDATAKILEIEEYLDRLPKQLSGGQAQRVAVGRALIKKPEVFLFDEPLSNLDAKLRASMRARITTLHRDLKASGSPATVVYVTHDQTEAMTMGDRICVMKEGVIQQVDVPETLYRWPVNTFVAGFIGTPEMNLVPAALDIGAAKIRIGDAIVPLGAAMSARLSGARSGPVTFGVRPQQLIIADAATPDAVPAKVRFVEYMGHDVTVHLVIGGHDVIALVSSERYSPSSFKGDQTFVRFETDRAHVFDAATGLNVSLPAEIRQAA